MTTIREIIDTPDNVSGAHKALQVGVQIGREIEAAAKKCPTCDKKMSACTCKDED